MSCAGGGGTDAILQEYPSAVPDVEHLFLLREGVPVPLRPDGEPCWATRLPATPWGAAATLRRTVRAQRPDLLHAHSSWAGTLVRSVPGRTPVIYTPHCFAAERTDQGRLAGLAVAGAERVLASRTAAMLAVAPREADLARALRPNLPVDLAYQCFRDRTTAERPNAAPTQPLDIVACGRLAPQKDPRAVVEVQRSVGDHGRVTWIGGGEPADAAALASAGVAVTGWLDAEQARARLGAAHVLVHLARWEGFPLVVFEAIAMGVVVIALDAPYLDHTDLPGVQPTISDVCETVESLASPEVRSRLAARQAAWYDAIRDTRPEARIAARYHMVARHGVDPTGSPGAKR